MTAPGQGRGAGVPIAEVPSPGEPERRAPGEPARDAVPVGPSVPAGVAASLARLDEAHRGGALRSVESRLACLSDLRERVVSSARLLEGALGADLGKHPSESLVLETGLVVAEIDHVERNLRRWLRPSPVRVPLAQWPGRARVVLEPVGTVLVVSPWNYPVQLALMPLVSAVAAGNCVALKPSELAPRVAEALATLLSGGRVGETTEVLLGDAATVHGAIEHGVDHVFFTGSTRVGRIVAAAAAGRLIPVTLELGGKCPAIVDESADLRSAARRIAWAKFVNAGQSCVAPDYVLADRKVADRLVAELAEAIHAMYGADPATSPDYPRVVDRSHHERLAAMLDESRGSVVVGGGIDVSRLYVGPTVLRDPPARSRVMEEEVFGPLLPVVSVGDLEEAIGFVSRLPPPLAVYAFSASRAALARAERATRSGAFCANVALTQLGVPDLPFGGVGESGCGLSHGRAGVTALSQVRSVLERPARPDLAVHRPPYTRIRSYVTARVVGAGRGPARDGGPPATG
ncbi:MAG: aldehyde dehydrogenase family protein [Actinomycetota bacterium]|nr:aldehyde dehydrogenase family protein [Actinomycetota bacterium]